MPSRPTATFPTGSTEPRGIERPGADQSDRSAHPWTVAEPGSWGEFGESIAFVFRAGGLALHPVHLAVCAIAAVAASWTLPIELERLLPWMGDQGLWLTLWAWLRLTWLVGVACVAGVALARMVAARPSRAEVWGVLPPQVGSAGLCVSTYISALAGAMLATWLVAAVGGWIGNAFGASLAAIIGLIALLGAVLATLMLLLAIPAIAANAADAPDAIQRAAAHLIARPGLSLVLLAISLGLAAGAAWVVSVLLGWAYASLSVEWEQTPTLAWLPYTLALFVMLGVGWAALTQTLLTLREVVDREDRASCWDPRPQAAAIHAAIEARADLARQWREASGDPATSDQHDDDDAN